MENVPGFNLRAQVVGQGGAYVKHIQQETRCRVQIKGRGSGFMEHSTGQESDEAMYLHVAGPDPKEVERAKDMCEDLLKSVRVQYEHFKANPPPQRMESYTDGYGADAHRGSYGGGYGRGRDRESYSSSQHNSNNNNYAGSPYTATPTTPAPGTAGSPTDNSAQWAAYYAQQPGGDPYAAYGGYEAYMAYYNYYAQQQAQQGGAPPGAPPGSTEQVPPPPSAAGSGDYSSNLYSSVPPPPGM
jgi:KH domain